MEMLLLTPKNSELPSHTLYKIYQTVTRKKVKYPPIRKSYIINTFG